MASNTTRTLLTRRQRSVLAFLRHHIRVRGYSPSNVEIAQQCGLGAPSGAHRIVTVLEERGYLRRRDGRNRVLELTHPPIGELPKGSAALFVVTVIRSFQRTVRGRLLRTVIDADVDDETMAALLADATVRNDFLRWYGVPEGDEPSALGADAFDDLVAQLSQRSTWSEFVVDHAVFNAGSAAGADQVLTTMPNLEPALLEVIAMSDASLRQCRRWFADILATGQADMVQLQRRALLMEHVSRVVADLVTERLGRAEVLGAEWGQDPLRRLMLAAEG